MVASEQVGTYVDAHTEHKHKPMGEPFAHRKDRHSDVDGVLHSSWLARYMEGHIRKCHSRKLVGNMLSDRICHTSRLSKFPKRGCHAVGLQSLSRLDS